MVKFGEVDWSEAVSERKEFTNNKDLFLRLDNGSNEVRIITLPQLYLSHKYKKEGDKGYGQKVMCSSYHGSCPLCEAGDKYKKRWFVGVIDRKSGSYKILDISYSVLGQLQAYAKKPSWGDLTKYDIDIIVDKKGGATGYYKVIPSGGKEPLSASDQLIKDNVDYEDLKRRVTPPTPDQVQKRIDKINGVEGASPTQNASQTKPAQAKKAALEEEDDEDEDFPSFD